MEIWNNLIFLIIKHQLKKCNFNLIYDACNSFLIKKTGVYILNVIEEYDNYLIVGSATLHRQKMIVWWLGLQGKKTIGLQDKKTIIVS